MIVLLGGILAALVITYLVIANTRNILIGPKDTRSEDENSILEIIGAQGEALVKEQLDKLPKEYIVRHNVYIPKDNGQFAQIDHLVFSPYAIFVIETKNYAGKITQKGATKPNHWLRTLPNGTTLEFYDPVLQNTQHIVYLTNFLGCSEDLCCPIVVFTGSAVVEQVDTQMAIRYVTNLNDTILSLQNKILTKKQITQFAQGIDAIVLPPNIAQIHKKNIALSHTPVGTCPKCGNDLVARTGKHGNFIGCSNYPNCKHTQN